MFRGVPRFFEASERLGTPREASDSQTKTFQESKASQSVPRFSEVFRGVPRPRNASEHLGRLRTPRLKHSMHQRRGRHYCLECFKSGCARPPEVFRGVPRPRNASEHLGRREASDSQT